jgi:hypothetical protein
MKVFSLTIICFTVLCGQAANAEIYKTTDNYVKQAFAVAPQPEKIWITGEVKEQVEEILDRKFNQLRAEYWREGDKTVWILEEIGKYKPITTGFTVNGGKIEDVQVLVYRESHGWEVKYPFFTKQFKQVALTDDYGLDKQIDGISGATLSVNALKKMARLALYLHAKVIGDEAI